MFSTVYGVDDIEEDDAENKVSTGLNKCSKTTKKIQRKLGTYTCARKMTKK